MNLATALKAGADAIIEEFENSTTTALRLSYATTEDVTVFTVVDSFHGGIEFQSTHQEPSDAYLALINWAERPSMDLHVANPRYRVQETASSEPSRHEEDGFVYEITEDGEELRFSSYETNTHITFYDSTVKQLRAWLNSNTPDALDVED